VGTSLQAPPPATPPTLPPWCVRGTRPRPHPHAFRHSPMYRDCGARARQGCCVPACAHCSPGCVWVGTSLPPVTPPTLPPWCVRSTRPRTHPHAFRHSTMCIDCGARVEQGHCVPACAHYSPGCVWVGGWACGRGCRPVTLTRTRRGRLAKL